MSTRTSSSPRGTRPSKRLPARRRLASGEESLPPDRDGNFPEPPTPQHNRPAMIRDVEAMIEETLKNTKWPAPVVYPRDYAQSATKSSQPGTPPISCGPSTTGRSRSTTWRARKLKARTLKSVVYRSSLTDRRVLQALETLCLQLLENGEPLRSTSKLQVSNRSPVVLKCAALSGSQSKLSCTIGPLVLSNSLTRFLTTLRSRSAVRTYSTSTSRTHRRKVER